MWLINICLLLFTSNFILAPILNADETHIPNQPIVNKVCSDLLSFYSLKASDFGGYKQAVVLDTNALMNRPNVYDSFTETLFIVPVQVLRELDNLQARPGLQASRAGRAVQQINKLMPGTKPANGIYNLSHHNGLYLDVASHLEWLYKKSAIAQDILPEKQTDSYILASALYYKNLVATVPVTFLSDDGSAHLMAKALEVNTTTLQSILQPGGFHDGLYTGRTRLVVSADNYKRFASQKLASPESVLEAKLNLEAGDKFLPNQYITFVTPDQKDMPDKALPLNQLLGFYNHKTKQVDFLPPVEALTKPLPLNLGLRMAYHALRNPDSPVVILAGVAGSGKTFAALASAMDQTGNVLPGMGQRFEQVFITRSPQPMGGKSEDIGFLPGSQDEKIGPFLESALDNLKAIAEARSKGDAETNKQANSESVESKGPPVMPEGLSKGARGRWKKKHGLKKYDSKGQVRNRGNGPTTLQAAHIKATVLAYIRGRSLQNQLLIVDEAQNLTWDKMKTIVTRIGKGSKLALLGDTDQIDTGANVYDNGLSQLIDTLLNYWELDLPTPLDSIATVIRLDESERSAVVEYLLEIEKYYKR